MLTQINRLAKCRPCACVIFRMTEIILPRALVRTPCRPPNISFGRRIVLPLIFRLRYIPHQ